MNPKTIFCKHPRGCFEDALIQALKQIKYGVIISSILQLIRSLKALTKGIPHMKKSLNPQFLSIIAFLSCSTLALRLVKCGLRWIRKKDDGLNSFVAGMISGYVGSKTLNQNYWYILLMFIASRIVSSAHQILMKEGYLNVNRSHFHYFLLFTFANIMHSYGYFMDPDIVNSDLYNLYERMSVLTPHEQRWHVGTLRYHQRVGR